MSYAFYTLGIVLAIVILLLILRGLFIRRSRATASYSPPHIVVVGGGWHDGGIGGIGGRGYSHSPSTPQPAAVALRSVPNTEATEPLPKYEAAPPGYDTLYKDGPPPLPQDLEAGEPSRISRNGRQDVPGEVVVNIPEPAHTVDHQAPSPPPPENGGVMGRMRGMAGRVTGR